MSQSQAPFDLHIASKRTVHPATHQHFKMTDLEPVHFFDLFSDLPGPQPHPNLGPEISLESR
jgi:hypothetical protein